MADILILAALPEEADALFPGTGEYGGGLFAERRLAVGGHSLKIATCGLGKVNAALCAGLFGADADMLLMTGTCGALGAAPGAYWIAEAVQHDYGAAQPGLFQRYRAGEWPIGEAGDVRRRRFAVEGVAIGPETEEMHGADAEEQHQHGAGGEARGEGAHGAPHVRSTSGTNR